MPTNYNRELLQKFCKENNIELLKDYSNVKVNREIVIEGKCIFECCHDTFSKVFRQLIISNAYCKKHTNVYAQIKSKNTCLEKYGVECSLQNEEVKEKKLNTCLEKYGVQYCMQNREIKQKAEQTNTERYGFPNPSQNKEIQQQKINTSLKNHGYEHHTQNEEVMEKCSKNAYKLKEYTLPSGKIIKLQGYEHYAFDELLQCGVLEEEIIHGCKNVPKIWYEDENNKKHRHYVDIFIPSQNKCIEVKSSWTAEKKKDCIFLKQQAGKDLGYEYEIWIYDGKGEKVKCYK